MKMPNKMKKFEAEFIPQDEFLPAIFKTIEAVNLNDAIDTFNQLAFMWVGEFINIHEIK